MGTPYKRLNVLEDYFEDVTAGTPAAGKPVLPDANTNVGALKVTSLSVGTSGSEVLMTATPAEINAACDRSARVVASADAGTLALTQALHEGRLVQFSDADGTLTLPEATGSGDTYRVAVTTTFTGGAITVAPSTDDRFEGVIWAVDTDDDSNLNYPALAGDTFDTITLNGVAKGGLANDLFTFIDVAEGVWHVQASLRQSGGSEATPFSSAISAA